MKHACQTAVALLILTFTISAQQVTTLEPGKAIDQTIAANETHPYALTLAPGMQARLQVDQKGTNLVVEVLSTDGQKLRHADLDGAGVPERLSLVATEPGQYRIETLNAPRPRFQSPHLGPFTL